jgi:hypothetical protein
VVAVYPVAVQRLDGLVRFRIAGHFDEAESLRPSGKSILDHFDAFHISKLGKQAFQGIFRCIERQVPNIDIHATNLSPGISLRRFRKKKQAVTVVTGGND